MTDITQHLVEIGDRLGPIRHVKSPLGLPQHWSPYVSESEGERLVGVRQELRKIEAYFPNTCENLVAIIIDAFVIQTEQGHFKRYFVTLLHGEEYLIVSDMPGSKVQTPAWSTFNRNAPAALVWIYDNVMDGLTDLYGFGGFYSSQRMRTMADAVLHYGLQDWFEEFKKRHDTRLIVEIFDSAGGAYLLVDLATDLSNKFEPQALLIDFKGSFQQSKQNVNLFPYLDEWMAIALAEA